MLKKYDCQFPEDFLWGAAISAHQVEGDSYNQWTIWEKEQSHRIAQRAHRHYGKLSSWDHVKAQAEQPDTYISGRAVNHRELYTHDFDLLKDMNMNALRFSIEWSRVEPQNGVWDEKEIEYYRQYVLALNRRGITPIVTLFHFTLPVWFAELGGFEKRRNLELFTRFAEKMLDVLGDTVTYIVTINEPESYVATGYVWGIWPPGKRLRIFKALSVYGNLARAHCLVADMIHAKSPHYKVSASRFCAYTYAGNTGFITRLSVQFIQWFTNDLWLKKTVSHCDWLGVNYYYSVSIHGVRAKDETDKFNDMGVPMDPARIENVLVDLSKKYQLPIIVTENGIADALDKDRKWWITETVLGMDRAIKQGVKLEGYIHWCLMDNFEWHHGYWARFGLYEVDYDTLERIPRSSALWFAKLIDELKTPR